MENSSASDRPSWISDPSPALPDKAAPASWRPCQKPPLRRRQRSDPRALKGHEPERSRDWYDRRKPLKLRRADPRSDSPNERPQYDLRDDECRSASGDGDRPMPSRRTRPPTRPPLNRGPASRQPRINPEHQPSPHPERCRPRPKSRRHADDTPVPEQRRRISDESAPGWTERWTRPPARL